VYEFKTTTAGFTYDTSNKLYDSSLATSQPGIALTLSGTQEAIVQIAHMVGNVTGISGGTYSLNIDAHGNGEAVQINSNNGAAPTFTQAPAGAAAVGAIALKAQ
jgi:hypothetical protein